MLISSKNTLTETSRITFDQIPGHYGPLKLTHTVNHHGIVENPAFKSVFLAS